jgi:hypothetical protein
MKKLIQILSVCVFFVVMGGTAIADRFDQYEKSTGGEKKMPSKTPDSKDSDVQPKASNSQDTAGTFKNHNSGAK